MNGFSFTAMEFAACAFALSRRNLPFVEFAGEFCGLAAVSELHDAAILLLFQLGANYQRPMDLPDTTGMCWREGIYQCPTRVRAARAPTRVRAVKAPTRVSASRAPPRVGPVQLTFASAGPVQLTLASAGPVQLTFASAGPVQLTLASAGPVQLAFCASRAPPRLSATPSAHESLRFPSAPETQHRIFPVALLSSVACELAPLKIVFLCGVFFYFYTCNVCNDYVRQENTFGHWTALH